MQKITVIYDNSLYVWYWLQPLIWASKELKKRGVDVSFAGIPSINALFHEDWRKQFSSIRKTDIVFLAFHQKSDFCLLPKKERICILNGLRKKNIKIVWLDCSDSTGTCLFDVLPYVDLYLKKQVLKDKYQYMNPMIGQRIYIDYYVKSLGLEGIEDETTSGIIENIDDIHKIDVSWNVSLWNNSRGRGLQKLYKLLAIDTFQEKDCYPAESKRNIKIFFNGTIPNQDNALTYQRKELIRLITSLEQGNCEASSDLLRRDVYVDKMKRSLLLPSPYGWGEVCSRDFEIFQLGGCLVKPSMEHLETFPNLYIPEVTYIPLNWDFSNFDEIISRTSTEEKIKKIKEIAKNGQQQFLKYRRRTRVGYELADHLCFVLKKHGI